MPPNTARMNTSITWFAMDAAEMASVPRLPTMMLSSRDTKEVINCWITMGISRVTTLL